MMDVVHEDPDGLKKLATVGNALYSVAFPFDKFLRCPSCQQEWKAQDIAPAWKFNHAGTFTYCGPCPSGTPECGEVTFDVEDRYRRDALKGTGLIRWPTLSINVDLNPLVPGASRHYFRLPKKIRDELCAGNKTMAATLPIEMIQAAKVRKRLVLNEGNLFTAAQIETFAHALIEKVREVEEKRTAGQKVLHTLLSFKDTWFWAYLEPDREGEPE